MAQMKLTKGQAIEEELQRLPGELLHSPAIVSFRVSQCSNDVPLKEAIDFWKSKDSVRV